LAPFIIVTKKIFLASFYQLKKSDFLVADLLLHQVLEKKIVTADQTSQTTRIIKGTVNTW